MGASIYPPPVAPAPTPTTLTSGVTATANFTVNNCFLTKLNGVATVKADFRIDVAMSAGSSAPYNLADTVIGTLPDGFRPRDTMTALYSTGYADGECDITSNGNITIRTTNTFSLSVGETIRVSATYVL
ncbi:baseplate protein [Streptomyces phage Endor2]|uniref:Baseplate protein n=1 Tax=Streptomyces phage Endor2 TaxID=2740182 RepID=A0A7G4AX29_9CAUD|nr:baseplate protein [Streptomyces phage Endor2]QMP84569.1 baseplate protein [Streptomyces phage Endor2]